MATFVPNGLSVALERKWVANKKYWYLVSLILPAAPLLFAYLAVHLHQGAWLWALLPTVYFILPLLDQLFGKDSANPSDDQVEQLKHDPYYARLLYGVTLMHWVALLGMAFVVSHWDWSWFDILGAALSAGFINGLGINTGHELGHKVTDQQQTLAAKLVLACSGYGHFSVEHNKGHHKDVATPEDPASSRFGESIYQFVIREIPGALMRALKLESGRLQRLGKSPWSWHNEILQQWALTLLAYGLMIALWGPVMVPFLFISAAFGWWQLTSANYVEHYGLLRLKDDKGRFQRCEPKHSWNSNFKASNLVLVHLQRHSDHHAHPTRPYQVLRDYDGVPQLPQGYFWMFFVALFPPVWFALMNHRVVSWADGDMNRVNIDPRRRAALFQRHHNPSA